jgi:hypothetical protein
MCRPPQIRQAALAGKVVQGQRSNAMVSADVDVSTKHGLSILSSYPAVPGVVRRCCYRPRIPQAGEDARDGSSTYAAWIIEEAAVVPSRARRETVAMEPDHTAMVGRFRFVSPMSDGLADCG